MGLKFRSQIKVKLKVKLKVWKTTKRFGLRFYLHVSNMYIVYMVNIRLKDLKFCRIQIFKHQQHNT